MRRDSNYSSNWDSSTGEVMVGGESAGRANSPAEAREVAEAYKGGGFLSGAFGNDDDSDED